MPVPVDEGQQSPAVQKSRRRTRHLESPPIESEGSGSDFETSRQRAKEERARKQRRDPSPTSDDDDDEEDDEELADEVVEESPIKPATSNRKSNAKAHPMPGVGEVDHDNTPLHVAHDHGASSSANNVDAGGSEEGGPEVESDATAGASSKTGKGKKKGKDKGKKKAGPGRLPAEFVKECQAWGQDTLKKGGDIGLKYGYDLAQVIRTGGLAPQFLRGDSLWNVGQAWKARFEPGRKLIHCLSDSKHC